jgi:hypothetical protein
MMTADVTPRRLEVPGGSLYYEMRVPVHCGWWPPADDDQLISTTCNGWLIINPVVYLELSVAYVLIEEVDAAAAQDVFRREPLPYEAAFLAGKAFSELPPPWWWPSLAPAGLLHRRACGCSWLPAADPGLRSVSQLLPDC